MNEYWITAERDTLLKKRPIPSGQLQGNGETRPVGEGTKYPVRAYSEEAGQHWQVELEDGSWYIFDGQDDHSHWRLSWEDDTQEEEIQPHVLVTSNAPTSSSIGDRLRIDSPFTTRITPHITYGEFALYQEERRFDHEHQCKTAYQLALFLEKCRTHFGDKPLRITSGYRPPKVNKRVRGAKRSEHLFIAPMTGAVDFKIDGINIYDVQRYCLENWTASVGKGASRGFVHLGMRGSKSRSLIWAY